MSGTKERILGAVTVMSEDDTRKVWEFIRATFALSNLEKETPDETDLAMLKEIENDPDCHEFLSAEEVLKELNI